jgi:hypothetical protein
VLADVAGLGAYFTVRTQRPPAAHPPWRPVRELLTDPRPLADRVAATAAALGSDRRVAASIAFQGLAAQLVSAPIAAVAVHGVLPALGPDELHWRPAASGPWPLCCPEPALLPPADLPALLLDAHLVPLAAAVRRLVPVSERVLFGNAASAVVTAGTLVGAARPAAAVRTAAVVGRLLAAGPLRGTGAFDARGTFRRRSCCLYHRVPGGGICGDCVLHRS